jgi:hypothetical protein
MVKRNDQERPRVCPRTGRPLRFRRRRWLLWLGPILGLGSLIWFLIRVVPKPSRAAYPCQRVAFPLASGFVTWLVGLAASAALFRRAKASMARRRWAVAGALAALAVGCVWMSLSLTDDTDAVAADPHPVNAPLGAGRGVHPGRVVWVHDPNATDWKGPRVGDGYWWQPNHTSQQVVDKMVSDAIRTLAGQRDLAAAWDALLRNFNREQGKGDVGYRPGEKIMIKVNFVDMIATGGNTNYNLVSHTPEYASCSPHIMHALLDQLVNVVGMAQSDITIGDPICMWCNEFYNMIQPDFPNVRYLDYLGLYGRTKIAKSNVPFYWSTTRADGRTQDYILTSYADAAYLINLASFKGHYNQAGITLCGKNHYGSLRGPADSGCYNMHSDTAFTNSQTGSYRNMVDLLGHKALGGKTLLCMFDALYGGKHAISFPENLPKKWRMPPFNDDWPSSIFVSQDPVAIDSVGFDFLVCEWPEANGPAHVAVDDYLHEAALANDPPSGTRYDPERDGTAMTSLGVHEHWNNPIDKQYAGNLGIPGGIELIKVPADRTEGDITGDGAVNTADLAALSAQWLDSIVYSETDGRLVMEAECYARAAGGTGPAQAVAWRVASDPDAAAGKYVQALPDQSVSVDADVAANAPRLGFLAYFATPGSYRLWLKGAAVDAAADRVYYGLDGVAASSVVIAEPTTEVLLSRGADQWLYLDIGAEQPGWKETVFEDGSWRQGRARLGYEDGAITELRYGPNEDNDLNNANNKYITYYFRKYFTVDNPSRFASLTVSIVRDDGAVVYINGHEACRSNMPEGPVTYSTIVRDHAASGSEETTFYDYAADPRFLQAGLNVVAVEVHQHAGGSQNNITSSDLGMDLELTGTTSYRWTSQRADGTPPLVDVPAAGFHAVDLWMHEDGAKLDRLLLTTDPGADPAAAEPAESPRTPLHEITADLTADGVVDMKDFAALNANWKKD